MNKEVRIKMVKAMELVARQINDEEVFWMWLVDGVPDGDIEYGDLSPEDDGTVEYWLDDKHFSDLMVAFLFVMAKARKSGGLYCDGVVNECE